ncbi:iron-sulfur cluster repair di-iron protein [Candidatus Gracilibacteria bacterium]|nr:iron-sulfur cluster repair di-iron protein [Candidatus Gracilibacteria bacterium]
MSITKDTTIADIVSKDYKTSEVFSKYKIDFCCHGHIPLGKACLDNNISFENIVKEIDDLKNLPSSNSLDLTTWPLSLIIDFVEKKHHSYIDDMTPHILMYLEKIAKVHGENHKELLEVFEIFKKSSIALNPHMREEENKLFPIIKAIEAKTASKEDILLVPSLIKQKVKEHDIEGENYRRLLEITNHYEVPADGCNTYKVAYDMLHEFHEDLLFHIHIENNILFPKVLKMIGE